MSRWIEPAPLDAAEGLAESLGTHRLVAQALLRRGYGELAAARAFLDPDEYAPTDSSELPGMQQALERLEAALQSGERILVWGDFDVDGQTATSLLVSALRQLDGQVEFHIPIRAQESHGVSLPVLQRILDAPSPPGLVLTCDTGIGAHAAVEFAASRGVDVVITDHHELPSSLPRACAIVNPRLLPAGHALAKLPGVGVAYKVVEALFSHSIGQEDASQFLDLVALGIVADVAELYGDTRYLLQRGLEQLRQPQRLGLRAIMETAGLAPENLTEEHIGFVLGPRLNALGRLDDANPAVDLLTTLDSGKARVIATQLEGLNGRRRLLTRQVLGGALLQIEQQPSLLDEAVLVLSHPEWPGGVIGIVASKLVERFHRPVALIVTPEGEIGRGSARSVEGLDITAAIAEQAELLSGFGGHRMAAGFGIEAQKIPDFRRGLARSVRNMLQAPEDVLEIDARLELGELNLDLITELERLAPFGPGNPALVLASHELKWVKHSFLGRDQEHLQVTVEDVQGNTQQVLWWGGGDWLDALDLPPQGPFDLAYSLRAATYRGKREMQVTWVDYRLSEEAIALAQPKQPVEVIDLRHSLQPLGEIVAHLKDGDQDVKIWAEGEAVSRLRQALPEALRGCVCTRLDLSPAARLVIWTSPPGRQELRFALEQVQPKQVNLFAIDPELDAFEPFIKRLAGLARYAFQSAQGRIDLERLAAAMAQRPLAVQLGLDWLAARRYFTVKREEGLIQLLSESTRVDVERAEQVERQLRVLLDESAAFRRYYLTADWRFLIF